jgi:hypothetical protein
VAGSPRSDDDKAGTPLAGLSCSCWVLHKPIEKSSAWGQKTPYYDRPTQDGLRGHFVLRAIGKRFRKDRTAGCEKVVGIRFALDSSLEEAGFELSVPLGRATASNRLLSVREHRDRWLIRQRRQAAWRRCRGKMSPATVDGFWRSAASVNDGN